MTNQYNSIIITDCRAVKICKVQDKCICKYKRGTNTCCCRAWFCCSERRPTMSMMASASASRAAIASVILLRSRSEYRTVKSLSTHIHFTHKNCILKALLNLNFLGKYQKFSHDIYMILKCMINTINVEN